MLIDDKKTALSTLTGLSKSIPDMELQWLRTSTGSSEFSIPQLWYIYLTTLGYSGSIPDMKVRYFQSLGYSGALPEMEAAFWAAGGAPSWGATMDRWWDFTRNISGVPTTLTDTHAQPILANDTSGVYSSFAANTIVRNNNGLQTVPTTQQLFASPNGSFTTTPWTSDGTQTQTQVDVFGGTSGMLLTGVGAGMFLEHGGNLAVSSGSTYTYVGIIKQGNFDWIRFVLRDVGFANRSEVWINMATGVIGTERTVGVGVGYSFGNTKVTTLSNGYFMVAITFTSTTTQLNVDYYPAAGDNNSSRPDVGSGAGVGATFYVCYGGLFNKTFAVPPIMSATTTNGNQQVIDLTGKLASGVGGIIQVDFKNTPTSGAVRVIEISNGLGGAGSGMILYYASGNLRLQVFASSAGQGPVDLGTWPAGVATIAFAAGTNYTMGRIVGVAAPTADTTVTWPSGLVQASIGGEGASAGQNNYQITKRLALKFGPQDATTFADLYAKAQLLAAVT